jgi:(R,R)-butanediol dehydrogenase/meso-butanediol dehydrogenase/diacetyl reductase
VRAVRWHARDDVRLDNVPVPQPGPSQVLVRVEAAAICGTDVDEVLHGPITVPVRPHPVSGRSAPMTLGHEIVGVVTEAGPASGVAVGTRVAPWPSHPCGRCRDCLTGHANRCSLMVSLGMSVDGGMADYLVVEESSCVPVGSDVVVERAVLVEPFAVALHAVHETEVAGRRIAVVGIGSLGLCVVEAAVLAGAGEVIAVTRSEVARTAALEAGATTAVTLEGATDLEADVVFETAGASRAIGASFDAVRRGGRILVLGGHARPVEIGLQDLTIREIALQGSVSHCFADFVAAANGITAGELARALRRVEFAPLDSAPAMLRAEGSNVKRILVPSQA